MRKLLYPRPRGRTDRHAFTFGFYDVTPFCFAISISWDSNGLRWIGLNVCVVDIGCHSVNSFEDEGGDNTNSGSLFQLSEIPKKN